jgi:hypothetical protein
MSTGAKDPHSLLFPDRQWNRIENNIGFVTRLGDRFQIFFWISILTFVIWR